MYAMPNEKMVSAAEINDLRKVPFNVIVIWFCLQELFAQPATEIRFIPLSEISEAQRIPNSVRAKNRQKFTCYHSLIGVLWQEFLH